MVAPENTLVAFTTALVQGADGVELDVRRSFGHRHNLFVNYAYQHPVDKVTGERIPNSPRHLANFGGTVGLSDHLSLGATVLLRDSRPRNPLLDRRPAVPSYGLVSLNLRALNIWNTLDLSLALQNLFNKQYVQPSPPPRPVPGDYPQAGRSALLSARYKF